MRALVLLLLVLLCAGAPALAQVTVDLQALHALSPTDTQPLPRQPATSVHPSHPRSHAPSQSRRARVAARVLPLPPVPPPGGPPPVVVAAQPPVAAQAAPAAVRPPVVAPSPPLPAPKPATPTAPVTVPSAPPALPPQVALAPMAPPDVAATPPPPPAIGTDADSHAVTKSSGLSVDFSPDADELSPDSAAAVRSFALAAPQSDGTSFNVLAFAHGDAQDASSARRLSLARALAIRSVLMAAGVPSTRIYVRALGSDAGSGPADRADISVMGLNAPTATAATTPPAKPPAKLSPAGEKPE